MSLRDKPDTEFLHSTSEALSVLLADERPLRSGPQRPFAQFKGIQDLHPFRLVQDILEAFASAPIGKHFKYPTCRSGKCSCELLVPLL